MIPVPRISTLACVLVAPALMVAQTPTQAQILALARSVLATEQAKLPKAQKDAFAKLKGEFEALRKDKAKVEAALGELVSQGAVLLGSGGVEAGPLLCLGATLVLEDPKAYRPMNLLGATLQAARHTKGAAQVLEYALALAPTEPYAHLNLGQVLLDLDQDTRARDLAHTVLATSPQNRDAWQLLASYHWKKKDTKAWMECLVRAQAVGGTVHRKTQKRKEEVKPLLIKETDTEGTVQSKVAALEALTPLNTADLLEPDFPKEAKALRDHWGRIQEDQRVKLPPFPTIDTTTLKGFNRDLPMLAGWMEAVVQRQGEEYKELGESTIRDLEKVAGHIDREKGATEAQAQAIAQKYLAEALGSAAEGLAKLQNVQAITGEKVEGLGEAQALLDATAKQKGVKLEVKDADPMNPLGGDNVSPLSRTNYLHYQEITKGYEAYMTHVWNSLSGLTYIPPSWFSPGVWVAPGVDLVEYAVKERPADSLGAVIERYNAKTKVESKRHEKALEQLEESKANEEAFLKEQILYIRTMNELGTTALKQWSAQYLPAYKQRLAPAVEGYWRVCWPYPRAMQDPKVQEREYKRVLEVVRTRGRQAIQMAGMGGFPWYGDTAEEEARLRELQEEAREAAEKKKPEILRQYKTGKQDDWVAWIEKNLSLDLQAQFIGLKATPGVIELNFWVFGPKATLKWDMVNSVVDTTWGFGAKINIGAKIGNVGLKVDIQGDTIMKTTRIDFDKGTVSEGWTQPKLTVKVGAGAATAGASATFDPFTRQVQAQGDVQAKAGIFDFSANAGYSSTTGQWTTSAGAKAGAGPVSGNASVKFDPVTQSAKYSASVGAKAGGELAPGIKAEGGTGYQIK